MNIDDDNFDFGFTAVSESELTSGQDEVTTKLQLLYNSILPLLKNLQSNPEKDYIMWPNRVKKIQEYKSKIDKIVGDSITTRKI